MIEKTVASATQTPTGNAIRTRPDVAAKGLRAGSIGLFGSSVLGVVQTAPAYSIAVTVALLAGTVGLQAPGQLLLAFVPILCLTIAQRELVDRHPDCGAAFVWVGRTLGPRAGWIVAWAIVAANLLALANLAKVVGVYAFLLIDADDLAASTPATLAVGLLALGAVTVLALRGLRSSSRLQMVLLGACLAILLGFAVVALAKVYGGTAGPQAVTPNLAWLNPFGGEAGGSIAVGLLLTVFLYWGWDVPSSVVEEADGGSRTSGRAMLVSAVTLLGIYAIVVVALQAYAGVGGDGIGLANETISADVLGVVAADAVGPVMGPLMEFAVFASAFACLAAAMAPAARLLLSMGAYRAVPAAFATVHRSGSPRFATLGIAVGVGTTLVALSVISGELVADAIGALVLFIALSYTVVGIACLWTFRREMTGSVRDLLTRGVAPLIGAAVLGWAFVRSMTDSLDPTYGATVIFGVGGIFVIWAFLMLLGLLLMAIWNWRAPAFFRNETFAPGWIGAHSPDIVEELRKDS
jgi:amino acid transporter